MDRFSRIILGYHGCTPEFAEALIRGEMSVEEWMPSQNPYDWLGHGIYFWEFAPHRAKTWAGKGGVVGAVIQLGTCLDLTDVNHTALLAMHFESVSKQRQQLGMFMPDNRGKRRDLDCLVINELAAAAEAGGVTYQTVRAPFLEGDPRSPDQPS